MAAAAPQAAGEAPALEIPEAIVEQAERLYEDTAGGVGELPSELATTQINLGLVEVRRYSINTGVPTSNLTLRVLMDYPFSSLFGELIALNLVEANARARNQYIQQASILSVAAQKEKTLMLLAENLREHFERRSAPSLPALRGLFN